MPPRPPCAFARSIAPSWIHPALQKPISALYAALPPSSPAVLHRILPFPSPAQPLVLGRRTLIMAILNATPDSFSDGGSYADVEAVVTAAKQMVLDGADLLDVGGLSTRPGARPLINAEEEAARVVPIIAALRRAGLTVPISIDTYRPSVARAALEAGASCINDVHAGREEGMLSLMASANVPVVLMHSRGDASDMTSLTTYEGSAAAATADDDDHDAGVVGGVREELGRSLAKALEAGVRRWNVVLDPGIGFAKTGKQNLVLLRSLDALLVNDAPTTTTTNETSPSSIEGYPLLVGASRKRFLGELTGQSEPRERGYATAAVTAACVASAAVDIVRVHDTRATSDFLRVLEAINGGGGGGGGRGGRGRVER
jgi:dihydroneopterin aldolase/2-amino-4-hydroxy-6-hydroxymethyldihydropteridine diphosphokinase/dihydropteroate synthase